uniref:Uncharacterized protein n=1 Tax=Tetranychus urticae TaxID=32264 RepID=T1L6I0_TETUR
MSRSSWAIVDDPFELFLDRLVEKKFNLITQSNLKIPNIYLNFSLNRSNPELYKFFLFWVNACSVNKILTYNERARSEAPCFIQEDISLFEKVILKQQKQSILKHTSSEINLLNAPNFD